MATYVFENEKEAEKFILSMMSEGLQSNTDNPKSVSHTVTMNNYRGINDKQYVGARMWVYGDSRVFVHVKRSLPEGVSPYYGDISDDPGKAVKKYNFYYQWFNKNTKKWVYVPSVLETTAPAGRYYPSFGIKWEPNDGITGEAEISYNEEKEYSK
jgi:hypothetical protein